MGNRKMELENNPARIEALEQSITGNLAVSVVSVLAQATAGRPQQPDPAVTREPGDVPGELFLGIADLIARLGYGIMPMNLKEMAEALVGVTPGAREVIVLGATAGTQEELPPEQRRTIRVQEDLTPVPAFRSLAHEVGHVLLGHTDEPGHVRMDRVAAGESPEDPRQELAAELSSAAVCSFLGVGSGDFETQYLSQHLMGLFLACGEDTAVVGTALGEVSHAALLASRIILRAVSPAKEGTRN
jgi:hypothetical protein